jgi:hypothetical protein
VTPAEQVTRTTCLVPLGHPLTQPKGIGVAALPSFHPSLETISAKISVGPSSRA